MVETSEAKQACRSVSSVVYPELDFGIKPCGSYTRDEFLDLLSQIVFEREFANTGGKTYQLDQSESVDVTSTTRNHLAKSFLYHLRNLSADAIDAQFDGVRDRLMTTLRERRLLPDRVDLAIDLHGWRYYGTADTDHVLTTYPDHRTTRAYCFATVCIVAPHVRFTLAVLPMEANGFALGAEAVRTLVETVREYVSIRHVFLDRGFYQVHVIAELNQLNVEYIIRARPSKGMIDRLSADAETVIDKYRMQRNREPRASAEVTVFAVPHRTNNDEHVWFVTNLDIEPEAAYAYAEAFRWRWGIETSYRQIGDFLPRTSSPTFSVRLFYFLFAVALYNLWVLANLLVSDEKMPETPPISTRIFRLFFAPRAYG